MAVTEREQARPPGPPTPGADLDVELTELGLDGWSGPAVRGPVPARGRRVLAAALVLALVAGAVAATSLAQARDLRRELADTRTAANAGEARAIVLRAQLRTTRADLRATSVSLAHRTAERDELDATARRTLDQLRRANAKLDGTSGALDEARDTVSEQVLALAVTRRCLLGVKRALVQASVDDFDGVVATLGSVEGACGQALSSTGSAPGSAAVDRNFPDPFVVRSGSAYFGYATNGQGGTIQLVRGSSPSSLTPVGEALAELPAWAEPGRTWAPSVLARGDRFVMYYAVAHKRTKQNCVSRAVADSPSGPFHDNSLWPILCQTDRGGSIDPSPFVDPAGVAWLTWKSEGVAPSEPARIWSQPLADDGLKLVGQPVGLITADRPWEGGVVEGPAMVVHHGRYYLFFSANDWNTDRYGVGYAVCSSPQGPCKKPVDGPVLASRGDVIGPGGTEFFTDGDGRTLAAYHAWAKGDVGYPGERRLYLAHLTFDGTRPVFTPTPVTR